MPMPSRYHLLSLHCTYSPAGMISWYNKLSLQQDTVLGAHRSLCSPFAPVSHFVVTGQKNIKKLAAHQKHLFSIIQGNKCHKPSGSCQLTHWPGCHYLTMCSRFSSKHRRYTSIYTVLAKALVLLLLKQSAQIIMYANLSLWPVCVSHH